MTCAFSKNKKNAHEAHGPRVYWQAEEAYEGGGGGGSALLSHANAVWQHGAGNVSLGFDVSIKRFISAEK